MQHVEAAWCAGDACQVMDPSAQRRPLFTPVVTLAETPHPRVEEECHRSLRTTSPLRAYPPSTRVPRRTPSRRIYIGVCVPALFICFSLVYSREFGNGAFRLFVEHIS